MLLERHSPTAGRLHRRLAHQLAFMGALIAVGLLGLSLLSTIAVVEGMFIPPRLSLMLGPLQLRTSVQLRACRCLPRSVHCSGLVYVVTAVVRNQPQPQVRELIHLSVRQVSPDLLRQRSACALRL